MAKGILIAAMDFSNVAEDEFNDWYDTEHIPERQRVPGFLSCQRWIGAAIGFAGLLLFMNPGLVDWSSGRTLLGNAFLLLSAIAWAFGSCLYRRRIWRTGFWTQTFWQLVVSAPVVLAFALPQITDERVHWSVSLVAILAYNWIVTTALGYFLWNRVLAAMPAAMAGQVMALTPIGGFLLSVAVFGGAVSSDVAVSIVLIVAGIILTLRA